MGEKFIKNKNLKFIIFAVLFVVVGFYLSYNYIYQKENLRSINQNTSIVTDETSQNNNLQVCQDFKQFSDFITKTVSKPEKINDQETVKESLDNPYAERYFTLSTGKSNEPFLAYPVILGTFSTYQSYKEPYKSNEELQKIYNNNLKLLKDNLNKKSQELGFESDKINNVVIKNNMENRRDKFAFIKGLSIYSVELEYLHGTQAVGGHYISVTCGKVLPEYGDLYNYVISSKINKWKEGEFIRVLDKSDDGKIVAIQNGFLTTSNTGENSTLGNFPTYYIKNQNSYQFLTKSSSNYGDCSFFENLKIGKGMYCMGDEYSFSKVTY